MKRFCIAAALVLTFLTSAPAMRQSLAGCKSCGKACGEATCCDACAAPARTLCGYQLRCVPQTAFHKTACCTAPLAKYDYCCPPCNPCRDKSRFWDHCPDCWHNLLPNR